MIRHDVTQGTPEWLALRCGIPTASCFDMIVTPKGKASTQAERYMHTLLAERIMGHSTLGEITSWMDRGQQLEAGGGPSGKVDHLACKRNVVALPHSKTARPRPTPPS